MTEHFHFQTVTAYLRNRLLSLRLRKTAVKIDIETIFVHPAADRSGFQLQHVDAPLRKHPNHPVQGARFMVDDKHHADLVRLRHLLRTSGNAEKPRRVELVVLDPFL